jgi:hypothetical protein
MKMATDRAAIVAVGLIVAFICSVILGGCATDSMIVANTVQRQAAEAIEDDYQRLVELSTAEIETKNLALLDVEIERRILEVSAGGAISEADLRTILVWSVGERDKIRAERDAKRKQLADSPNLDLMRKMNQAIRDRLITESEATAEIERLIGGLKK